ncbi:MAG: DNA-processing protein DprA [Armatimonadota bacterium]
MVKTLKQMDLQPGDLLEESNQRQLIEKEVDEAQQVIKLLDRGLLLATAVDTWESQGIWIVGWSDQDYPEIFRERLKGQAPPLLYGLGEKALLAEGGLAIIGSRNVDEEGILFTRKAAHSCASHGVQVISGGARGVDREAMSTCLDNGWSVIGVLADSLARYAVSSEIRDAVIDGALVLISQVEPEAHFHVGNAMARNKLIYSLADFALVISSEFNKGGTWAGATDNLKKRWVPLFVRSGDNVPEGNLRLLESDGIAIDEDAFEHNDIVGWMQEKIATRSTPDAEAISGSQWVLPL